MRPAAHRARTALRTSGAALAITVGILVGGTALAGPAVAADRDGGGGITVTSDGVSFDPQRLWHDDGWLSYTITRLDGGGWPRYYGTAYRSSDVQGGFLPFSRAATDFPDGYCVVNVHVSGIAQQHAPWRGDDPVCTTEASAEPEPAPTPTPAPTTPSPTPTATATPSATPSEPSSRPSTSTTSRTHRQESAEPPPAPAEPVEAEEEPVDEPAETDEPEESEDPEESEESDEERETTAVTRPERGPDGIVGAGERTVPPAPTSAGSATTVVLMAVGGFMAVAGGATLLVRRLG